MQTDAAERSRRAGLLPDRTNLASPSAADTTESLGLVAAEQILAFNTAEDASLWRKRIQAEFAEWEKNKLIIEEMKAERSGVLTPQPLER